MMTFDKKNLDNTFLIQLYEQLVKPRLIEEQMLIYLRQGGISKWFSGIGQEAIAVGATLALDNDEYILPLHRNLGVFTSRNISLRKLLAQFQGKITGFTQGRDRSFHFGSNEHHIVGMISHLGPQLAVADGIALAQKLKKQQKSTLVFCGDGCTSEGDFHEALNLASTWDLPVIFVIENNGYSLSTPTKEQFKITNLADKAAAYGIEGKTIDGNNILEVYHTIKYAKEKQKTSPAPILIEAKTFRMRGHEEASGTAYVPEQLFELWEKMDPVENYEKYLFDNGIISHKQTLEIRQKIKNEIEQAIQQSEEDPYPIPSIEKETSEMYAHFVQKISNPNTPLKSNKRYIDAIADALNLAQDKFKNLVYMGQDIAEYGGVFKATKGLVEKFGKDKIRNTPLCESAVLGSGLGLSIGGYKSMIEMQFADFVSCGFNQIVNNIAKSHYRWGQNCDVVVRMPTGAGTSAGPYHSQSTESWFFHTPGLKIVYPSSPYAAKGLLLAAIEDPNPVMYFEHKYLYRSIAEDIPDDYYTIQLGKARTVTEGEDLTIITYGLGVIWAEEICKTMAISAEIVDLQTLTPWDKEAVELAVKKTGKVLVFNEDTLTGSISAEIAAWISENCFTHLDAPIMREGALDTAVPFTKGLENQFLPKERIKAKLRKLIEY